MPRLIKIDKDVEREITHRECGAVIGYYGVEIKDMIVYDYGGGSEVMYYIECPNCGKKVEIK